MIVTVEDNDERTITKQVSTLNGKMLYVCYCFLWRGPFRIIYRNIEPASFSAWMLNRNTGIWGCFADDGDIGFDHAARVEEGIMDLSTKLVTDVRPFEKLEDKICTEFLDEMIAHIERLFDPNRSW